MIRKSTFLYGAITGAIASVLVIILITTFLINNKPVSEPPTLQTDSGYILRDENGTLTLYDTANGMQIASYEIYTNLLPESDVAALKNGIPVSNEAELRQLLEDLGG